MKPSAVKTILISGASIAGLTCAYWLSRSGYKVTVVEMAAEPRISGAAVDLKGPAIDIVKRMGIFEQLQANGLGVDRIEFKDANDVTEGSITLRNEGDAPAADEIEIERDKLMGMLSDLIGDRVEFRFDDRIAALDEAADGMQVIFRSGDLRAFDLVIGCDGSHSGVRQLWFGPEQEYSHFLGAYSSITTVDRNLVADRTMQMYNVPGKGIVVNAYRNKTDIIFFFVSDAEIPYDYRDAAQQREIIMSHFSGERWRTGELLDAVRQEERFYFDKFCQIKMPSWTKGRVALAGDAGYCASPAAGMGGSIAMIGATALSDALQRHEGNFEAAFRDYNRDLRPFIEEVQAAAALNLKETFIPRTEEAIRERNRMTSAF